MKPLNDALESLKSELTEKGYRVGLVEEISKEWDVRPEFLERKFREATGVRPEQYVIIDLNAQALDRAKVLANLWWNSDFSKHGWDKYKWRLKLNGKKFLLGNKAFVAVELLSTLLFCVRVITGEKRMIEFKSVRSARLFESMFANRYQPTVPIIESSMVREVRSW